MSDAKRTARGAGAPERDEQRSAGREAGGPPAGAAHAAPGRPWPQAGEAAEELGAMTDAGKRPDSDGPRTGSHGGGDGSAAIEGDLEQLVERAAQRDEYLALAQRTQADFENYRKRVAREGAAAQERGAIALAKELLPALDNLDRAIQAAAAADPLLEGVRLVRSELAAALARVGIESFSPIGEVFDPAVHEAMATLPQPPGGAPSGTVVEVYQDGYRLGENVIRAARVVVAA